MTKRPGRPRTNFKDYESTTEQGTKEGEIRATYIVKIHIKEALKIIAQKRGVLIKELVNDLFTEFIEKEKRSFPPKAKKILKPTEERPKRENKKPKIKQAKITYY
jgi:hypothetical protein